MTNLHSSLIVVPSRGPKCRRLGTSSRQATLWNLGTASVVGSAQFELMFSVFDCDTTSRYASFMSEADNAQGVFSSRQLMIMGACGCTQL